MKKKENMANVNTKPVVRDDFAEVDPKTPYSKLNDDIAAVMRKIPRVWWVALAIPASIVLFGWTVFYYQSVEGLGLWATGESMHWGLDLPTFIFFIGLSHSGTLISAILLFTKSAWRRSIYRAAEAMTFFSLICAGTVLLMHLGRPWRFFYMVPYPNMRTVWTNFRSALSWDMVAIGSYMLASGIFLALGSIPDWAAVRNRFTGWRRTFFNILSFGWKGTDREWRNLNRCYLGVAALLFPLMVSVHSIVSWDFAVTNVPGFHSTIFAPFFVLGAIYSGVAGVVMVMVILRRTLHLHDYIKPYHIDMLAKMLLIVVFIWIWVTSMEILGPIYKTQINNFEYMAIVGKLVGTWAIPYWLMIVTCGIVPISMLWKKVRTNMTAMFLITTGVQIGMWSERFIILSPGQGVGYIPAQWSTYSPHLIEAFLFWIFTSAIFLTPFVLFVKFCPPVSVFEVKEILDVPMRRKTPEKHEEKIPAVVKAKRTPKIPPEVITDEG